MPTRDRPRVSEDALALVLAGGLGKRLYPLTQDQTKAAVSFGGMYRLIDFTLSNCLHSGLWRIAVLAQHKLASLERHLRLGWSTFRPELGGCLEIVPPPQRIHEGGYQGTADAVYQNIRLLEQQAPRYVLVLAADHVYRMDYGKLLDYHVRCGAELTIAGIEVEREEARRFGTMEVDAARRIVGFVEKPDRPQSLLCRPGFALASMGIYVFDTRVLIDVLIEDARRRDSTRDFGHDVIPRMISSERNLCAYNVQEEVSRDFYWRDIGTIDAYWEASMELLSAAPPLDPLDPDWPVHTFYPSLSAAQILLEDRFDPRGTDALLCPEVQVIDAQVERSILCPGVTVDPQAEVFESVLMEGVHVGPGARIHRAIVDKGVRIPADYCIGGDPIGKGDDSHLTSGGITVVPRGAELVPDGEARAA